MLAIIATKAMLIPAGPVNTAQQAILRVTIIVMVPNVQQMISAVQMICVMAICVMDPEVVISPMDAMIVVIRIAII